MAQCTDVSINADVLTPKLVPPGSVVLVKVPVDCDLGERESIQEAIELAVSGLGATVLVVDDDIDLSALAPGSVAPYA